MRIELVDAPNCVDGLVLIEQECFTHPLEKKQLRFLLQDCRSLFFCAYEDGDTPVGSVWLQAVLDEGYIGNVAVRPAFRRRGIADALLDRLDIFAREKKLSFLTLEVREGNIPAIALYEKHGYTPVGRRPAYYHDPREDAVLMTKTDFSGDSE